MKAGIRRNHRLLTVFVFAMALFPVNASADAGLPMIIIVWPASGVLFLPIVVIEALVARKLLGLTFRRSLGVSAVANAVSTVGGIPLTWALLVLPLFGVALLPDALGFLALPFYVAWLPPVEATWLIPLAVGLFCVPCFFASVFIERWVARRLLRGHAAPEVRRWSWVANLWSYGAIWLALLIAMGWLYAKG
jgi:hypothetical protein